jgi:hypothetical protein
LSTDQALSESDRSDFLAITSRSQATRVFQADQTDETRVVIPTFFIPFARRHLGLPQRGDTLGIPVMDAHGNATFRCPAPHDSPSLLDARGDHAITCRNSKTVRIRGHNELRDVCIRAGKEAGLQARAEPPTTALLANAFTDQELAKRWPGMPTKESREHYEKVHVALQALIAVVPKGLTPILQKAQEALRKKALEQVQYLLDTAPSGHGLRLDGELIAPGGGDMWFDVTMFHPTSAGRRAEQLKWLVERAQKESEAADAGRALPNLDDRMMSPAMIEAVKNKHDKYAPVV